jgi:hypothetical protein
VDRALRGRFRDDGLKHTIVKFLVEGAKDRGLKERIVEAALVFDTMANETERLAGRFELRGKIAFVDAGGGGKPYDKTELLLKGQKLARVSIVRDSGMITVASAFDSGLDFVEILTLGGGMPTRVSIAESRLGEVLEKVNARL